MAHDSITGIIPVSPTWTRSRALIACVLYVSAMMVFFVGLMFPFDQLQARLLSMLSRALAASIEAGTYDMVLPSGVVWNDVRVQGPNGLWVPAHRVELMLDPISVLKGSPQLKGVLGLGAGATSKAGLLRTELALGSLSFDATAQLSGHLEQIDLSRMENPKIRHGLLNGTFSHRWERLSGEQEFVRGEGQWEIELTGLSLEDRAFAAVPLHGMAVSKLQGMLLCADGMCRIQALKGEGMNGMVTGEGTLELKLPIEESVLKATLWLTVGEALGQNLPVGAIRSESPFKVSVTGPLAHVAVAL